MAVSTHRPLPKEIRDIQLELEETCRGYGLDFFETIFEMVDYEEMSMLAAYGGFPTRYPHWRFGAQFDELMKGYSYGLQKIYEMVINTDPCYAYLLRANELTDQKLVIAHVYAHCDFFKNNAWFAHTNRRMLDEMANHATRVNRYVDRLGYEEVEQFIDACLSLENLIDPYWPHVSRASDVKRERSPGLDSKNGDEEEQGSQGKFPAKGYMDSFINPPGLLEQEKQSVVRNSKSRKEAARSPPNRGAMCCSSCWNTLL